MMIYKRENFIEENPDSQQFPVRQIEKMSAIDGSSTKFVGRVSLGLETPMGVQTMPVSFEIEADTVEDAFAQFESRRKALEQIARRHASLSQVLPREIPRQPVEIGPRAGGIGDRAPLRKQPGDEACQDVAHSSLSHPAVARGVDVGPPVGLGDHRPRAFQQDDDLRLLGKAARSIDSSRLDLGRRRACQPAHLPRSSLSTCSPRRHPRSAPTS